MYEATVGSLDGVSICVSCSFISNHIIDFCGASSADGCAVKLQSNRNNLSHSISRESDIVFDCFSVQESGNYSVSVYEIQHGVVQEHTSIQLGNVITEGEVVVDMYLLLHRYIPAGYSLIHSLVEPVEGGVCISCVFNSGSTSKGCIVKLYNDLYTFYFNMSLQSPEDMSLLECFKVTGVGDPTGWVRGQ